MPPRQRLLFATPVLVLSVACFACTRQAAPSFFIDTPLLHVGPPAPDTMPGDPGPLDRREMLRLGPVAGRAVISTDRRFVAYLDREGRVHAARCTGDSPGVIPLDDLPPASALAFEPGTSTLYFAYDNTWVRRVDLASPDEQEKWTVPVEGAQGAPITGLEVSAYGRIAWSTGATQRAGLIDAASGEALATFTDAGSPVVPIPETCRIRFDPTGAHAVLTRELPTGPLMLTILDAASGRERTVHRIYVSMREPGFAFVSGGVVFGWRDATPRDPSFKVMHLDLATSAVRVIEADADAAHFISLLASPNGERLARADLGVNQLTLWEASTGLVPRREHPLRLCDTLGWDDSGAMLWMRRRAISPDDAHHQHDARESIFAFDPDTGNNLGPLDGLIAPALRHVLRITGGPRTPLIVEWESTSGESFISVLWLKPSR